MKKISRRSFIELSAYAAGAIGGLAVAPSLAVHALTAPKEDSPFVHWSFGGQLYANPMSARSMDFQFWFSPVAERRPYSFRQEVYRACELLEKKRNGAPIALCYSGGVDSEVIANTLHELGIPFELYFADFWGVNLPTLTEWAKPVAKKWNKEVNVVSLGREEFKEYAMAAFERLGCESPTYLGLTALFSKIPSDRLIVTGDGDLDRRGPLFAHLGKNLAKGPIDLNRPLVFSSSSVIYDAWARQEGRRGVFYFYRSTPGLVAAALTDPRFQVNYPFSDSKEMLHASFPEVQKRAKTTNWEMRPQENVAIRRSLQAHAAKTEGLSFWRRLNGTIVHPDKIFRS